MIGRQLGQYKIAEEIGRGGMGAVYRATQISLKRDVALKVLNPEKAPDPTTLERFRREGEAIARVAHPNVVQVFDIGEQDGLHFIAMEYVEGSTVEDMIVGNDAFEFTEAVSICAQVAAGLNAIHSSGLIHRDIKPSNILVDKNGFAKLGDLGIAALAESENEARLTMTMAAIGTPYYMSPEQVRGRGNLSPASDIYSLGMVLYEMLSGSHPFGDSTPTEAMSVVMNETLPPLRRYRPDIPDDLESVINSCLSKDPRERPESAEQLQRELEKIKLRLEMDSASNEEETDSYRKRVTTTGLFYTAPDEMKPRHSYFGLLLGEMRAQARDPNRKDRRNLRRLSRETATARAKYKKEEQHLDQLRERRKYHRKKSDDYDRQYVQLVEKEGPEAAQESADNHSKHESLYLDYDNRCRAQSQTVDELRQAYDAVKQKHSERADRLALLDSEARAQKKPVPSHDNPSLSRFARLANVALLACLLLLLGAGVLYALKWHKESRATRIHKAAMEKPKTRAKPAPPDKTQKPKPGSTPAVVHTPGKDIPKQLIFWNKLDSENSIRNSEVGVPGKITGPISFADMGGVRGVSLDSGQSLVRFDNIFGNNFPEAGCIEFWWWPQHDENSSTGSHMAERFPFVINGTETRKRNSMPAFMIRVNYRGHGKTAYDRTRVAYGYHDVSRDKIYGSGITANIDFQAGQLMHVAIVWNEQWTIDVLRLYVNGLRMQPVIQGKKVDSTELITAMKRGSNTSPHSLYINRWAARTDGAKNEYDPNQYVGDFKIWNYAKTNFEYSGSSPLHSSNLKSLPKLIFSNSLDSVQSIQNGEIGYKGTIESGEFVEGVSGKAISLGVGDMEAVTFTDVPIYIERGCIEFWAKLEDVPERLEWGQKPAMVKFHPGPKGTTRRRTYGIHFNGNDGGSQGGLCAWAGACGRTGTGRYGSSWTYEKALLGRNHENWHHYALVWNENGIPGIDDGSRQTALYVDGKLSSGSWKRNERLWPDADILSGPLHLMSHQNLKKGKVAIDELKIWNYAKTDFSLGLRGFASSISKGPVLYFPFDEDEGPRILDQSGNNMEAQVHGARWTSQGRFGGAYSFDGDGDYIELPDKAKQRGPFTVSIWFTLDKSRANNGISASLYGGGGLDCSVDRNGIAITWRRKKSLWIDVYDTPKRYGLKQDELQPDVGDGQWHHVVGTYDGDILRLYIDGKTSDQAMRKIGKVVVDWSRSKHYLGRRAEIVGQDWYWKGKMDELMIFNRALTPHEIKKLYTGDYQPIEEEG